MLSDGRIYSWQDNVLPILPILPILPVLHVVRKTADRFLLVTGLMSRQGTNAGVARNPVDSFFVVRCFVHTLGTFFIPKGLHIKAQGCGTPLPWGPGVTTYTLP